MQRPMPTVRGSEVGGEKERWGDGLVERVVDEGRRDGVVRTSLDYVYEGSWQRVGGVVVKVRLK